MTQPLHHVVAPGDTLRSIAAAYGVSPTDIWEHPNNAQLRRHREPNVLATGDRVWIPTSVAAWIEYDRSPVPCRTGRSYTFCHTQRVTVRLHFEERDGSPMADWNYRLTVRGRTSEGRLSREGVLTTTVAMSEQFASIELWPPESHERPVYRFGLAVGHLEPAGVKRGVQQRLGNLGLYDGPIDGQESKLLDASLARFRAWSGVPKNASEEQTIDELRRKHRG